MKPPLERLLLRAQLLDGARAVFRRKVRREFLLGPKKELRKLALELLLKFYSVLQI